MIDQRNHLPCLPEGWVWTTLGKVCLPPQYGWTTSASSNGEVRLLRTTDITSGHISWDTVPFCTEAPENISKYLLQDGDIVISRAGSVGFSHLVKNPERAVFASYLIRFRPVIDEKYVAYFLKSPLYWQAISERSLGIAIPNVNASKLKEIPFPLPPLTEQLRIVAKIEELFTQLDAGTAALQQARALLRRYRQAVLKAAVSGELTGEWRQAQGGVGETAEELLRRLGKEPVEGDGLAELPEGWCWTKLADIAAIKGGITKDSQRKVINGRKIPYLRVANVQRGYFDLTEVKEIEASESEISELLLEKGDILFTEGGDRDKLGRGWIWSNELPQCIHQNHIFRARLYDKSIVSEIISWFGNTFGKEYFQRQGKQTTNLASINLTKLSQLPVLLPPIVEQHQIVAEVERRLSVAAELESAVEAELSRAGRLRKSILKRAFEGRLLETL
jgi:type I restriction enzyme, S subunit